MSRDIPWYMNSFIIGGGEFDDRIEQILKGRIFEPKHIHLFAGYDKEHIHLIDGSSNEEMGKYYKTMIEDLRLVEKGKLRKKRWDQVLINAHITSPLGVE